VRIRPVRDTDIDAVFEAVRESIGEISPWLAWCHPKYSREESQAWVTSRADAWAKGVEYTFAIVDAGDSRFFGVCSLNQIHPLHRFANLGYWVRTSAAGRGVASAATLLVARFGFAELGLVRVEIVVDVANLASLRVAEKVKATREGIGRNRLVTGGRVSDAVMFSLTPQDLGLELPGAAGR
jgi:RimJ/RimL family protein N-acetyltransferase